MSGASSIVVTNLPPGTYTSTEADPTPAFDLTDISCSDGGSATPSTGNPATRTATFRLDPGETVTCTFTNTERITVRWLKARPFGFQARAVAFTRW